MVKKRKKKSSSRRFKRFNHNFNLVFGTVIFILLIGSAFSIDWIFGAGFVVAFFLAVWNRTIERNFLIPAFIFIGALVVRYALFVLLPEVLKAHDYFSLGISLVLFLVILFIGLRIKRGKFRF